MKKENKIIGRKEKMMNEEYYRIFPQTKIVPIGSFVLLDHFPERVKQANPSANNVGIGAHPHKGIATFTYVINGEIEHFDSLGNNAVVTSGGIQWMNSGNGIVHDEGSTLNFSKKGGKLHVMQFWVVLPSKNKKLAPVYLPVQSHEIPEFNIDTEGSIMRILIGEYQGVKSKIPTYLSHFLYHLKLQPNSGFYYTIPKNTELGIIPVNGNVFINSNKLSASELLSFYENEETFFIQNKDSITVDLMLFGGEPYKESIAAGGPFIMNTEAELKQAYSDYNAGAFGKISYPKMD